MILHEITWRDTTEANYIERQGNDDEKNGTCRLAYEDVLRTALCKCENLAKNPARDWIMLVAFREQLSRQRTRHAVLLSLTLSILDASESSLPTSKPSGVMEGMEANPSSAIFT